ncbi:MAG TPA: pitrilysin family protein [Arenimonas sp.]|uniref:M16 family metallopeptidase n=1 Tax=Arenimonas sp. TaxID=1872635 RepID=UPI002D806A64|nr:pitrilysin family protein [Arenimonas sp.]HEU0153651.1 pitrilysin family protein [Arenimonas sp.]
MRPIALLAALLLATAPPAGLASERAPAGKSGQIDLAELRIPHHKFVLDNGLTVLVHEDPSVPLVAVNLWYHVGSRNEVRGRTGFAHLFEHFFFNGSENHPHGFREAMDDLGANNRNGTTSTDRTNFFEDVPVSGLERTLYLEADRMGFLAGNLDEAMLERERGVVKNEKRQGENQPYGRAWTRITETLYPYSHPYSWSPIGSMEDLDRASMDDIRAWYADYYGPNNAVLSLAGDITLDQAKTLVTRYFGGIAPGKPVARQRQWVPALDADIRDSLQDQVPQTRIYRAWHLPPMGARATHAMDLFASVLAGSDSSPLSRRLVFDTNLATGVQAGVQARELASLFLVVANVRPGVDPAELERELDAQLAKALAELPDADALARARTGEVAGFVRGKERLGGFGGRSDVLAESMTYFGDPEGYLQRFRDYQAITPAELRDTARTWLSRPSYTLQVDPFPALKAVASDLDRSQLPALGPAPDVDFPEVQRATLGNGLKVVLLERHSAPLVNLMLAVDAGIAADPVDARGTANFALDLLLKGSRKRDAFRIADDRDALGAQLLVGNGLDQSFVRLGALRSQLGPSLDLMADVALNPAFPADMVELQRKQQLAAIGQQKANPGAAAQRVLPSLLYAQGHPYAAPGGGLGTEAAVSDLSREALAQWHARWFVPSNATVVVAGDITLPELVQQLERSFGGWTGGPAPAKAVAATTSPGRGVVHLIDKPGAPQTVIVAAHLAPPSGQSEDLALETVMRNFGGMATSRLNRNLRLEKHWSYGAYGGLNGARGPRTFVVNAPVQTDKTREAILEVKKEIEGVAGARPLAGEEYDSILRSQVARLPGRYETLDSLVSAALDMVNTGRDPAYYANYARDLAALDADALNAAATDVVRPDQLTWVIVGDLDQIEAGIRALELGEVRRITVE